MTTNHETKINQQNFAPRSHVAGFYFYPSRERAEKVLLIRKAKPAWQKGLLSCVGGRIEDFDESVAAAMAREFEEEAGIKTTPDDWQEFAYIEMPGFLVSMFWAEGTKIPQPTAAQETEPVSYYNLSDILMRREKTLPNIPWFASLALDTNPAKDLAVIYYKDAG